MDDREKKIAEIRERHSKATNGPWKYEIWQGLADIYTTSGEHIAISQWWAKTEESMENAENNAYFIANSWDDVRFLLSELDRIEHEYAEERAAHNAHVTELCELKEENRKLRKDVERLKEENGTQNEIRREQILADVSWLIKQAERVEELEREIERREYSHIDLYNREKDTRRQNKRYREALEKIVKEGENGEFSNHTAREALEEKNDQ